MKICAKCGDEFPKFLRIDGKYKNFQNRKYCFNCSSLGNHNTKKLEKIIDDKKICLKCGELKNLKEYYNKHKIYKYPYCNVCFNKFSTFSLIRKKKKALTYKGGKCIKCGYDKYYGALHFHHRDPLEKKYDWSKLRRFTWDVVTKELDKCDLLCSNCHAETHRMYD